MRSPSAASTPISPATTPTASSLFPTYIDRIKAGHIVPGAKWTIVQESPTTTVIDGHWGFGFHVNAKAMALTIEKAKTANVAACTVFRQSHVGRLAAYPLMAMREGMIGIATAEFRPLAEARRAVRRQGGAARHQPDLDRGAVRSRSAVLSGHGDLGGRGRQDPARGRARRGDSDGMDHRCRGTAHHRSRPNIARAARCCRSAAPRATRAAAWPQWSRCSAACSPVSASASSRRGGTMTDASWRCSTSPRSAR